MNKFYKVYTNGLGYKLIHGYFQEHDIEQALLTASMAVSKYSRQEFMDTVYIAEINFGATPDLKYEDSKTCLSIGLDYKPKDDFSSDYIPSAIIIAGPWSEKFVVPEKLLYLPKIIKTELDKDD